MSDRGTVMFQSTPVIADERMDVRADFYEQMLSVSIHARHC